MEITEVRIKLTEDSDDRLQAFCSITFDDAFVVRDLKIIEGTNGPFVAMPSRKLTTHCQRCRSKNHIRANYCNQCGAKMEGDSSGRDHEGRAKLYADIAHPINSACREMIQSRVVEEYSKERDLAQRPGYVSRYEDDYDDVFIGSDFEDITVTSDDKPSRPRIDVPPSQSGPRPPHSPSGAETPKPG
ncbi:MAG: SpoVG family protein, partial [Pirellulaceae bacterium]